jgi:hypothetical protein
MYLDAVHNKRLLVVFLKIYAFQIYARRPVFLALLKLIMELCVGWSVTALEFQGHSGNNCLVYLYNNQHNSLIHYFILRFCVTCFSLSYGMSTFKEIITICHAVHVASLMMGCMRARNTQGRIAK